MSTLGRFVAVLALLVPATIIANVSAFRTTPKIIGGAPASIDRHPYQAVLLYEGRYLCGAVIVSPTKLLTAAHCVYRINAVRKLDVRAGSAHPLSGGIGKQASKIVEHHGFDPSTMDNDIAVVTLAEPLPFGNTIGAIRMAKASDSLAPGTQVLVSGFGSNVSGELKPSDLHAVVVPIVEPKQCAKAYKNYEGKARPTAQMICAGFYKAGGGKDACKGDSGG